MNEEARAKVENKVLSIAKLADEICESVYPCEECPLFTYGNCAMEDACNVAVDIQEKRAEEPDYENLPIDLDDNQCDGCSKPSHWGCYDKTDCKEDYPIGECCEDNLQENVGKILFKYGIVDTKLAKALIEIIQKERERNEYLHLYGEHFTAE